MGRYEEIGGGKCDELKLPVEDSCCWSAALYSVGQDDDEDNVDCKSMDGPGVGELLSNTFNDNGTDSMNVSRIIFDADVGHIDTAETGKLACQAPPWTRNSDDL